MFYYLNLWFCIIIGGGSGGTIWIECEEIIGHGRMSANGGNGGGSYSVGGGGGGGGRISIKSDNVNKLNITLDAYGGEYLVLEEYLTQLMVGVEESQSNQTMSINLISHSMLTEVSIL